ncbi:hypothetical protein JB92DRAFT_3012538 [Gautieria morchelliformis]|nr:hypothetical protein JB92DRAFT_3012538 [Gautieria morchelliformis]
MQTRLAPEDQLFHNEQHTLAPLLKRATHFPSIEFNRATFGGLPVEDILHDDDATPTKSGEFFPCGNTSGACVASILDPRRPHRSSRPSRIRVASFVSSSAPISTWFDDSPTRGVFTIADDGKTSTLSWDQQLFDELAYSTFPHRECDETSITTFDPDSQTTSSPASESNDSHTMVPTEDDNESTSSGSKYHLSDCLDEQLLRSPMDSFAAMCWEAAVLPEQPKLNVNNSQATELRLSRLYSHAAQQYEQTHIRESSNLATVTLPRMQFNKEAVQVSETAPEEVTPWVYVSKKAASMLDLPQDLSVTLRFHGSSVTPSRPTHQRHRRGKMIPGSISKFAFNLSLAGKGRKAVDCLSGEHKP